MSLFVNADWSALVPAGSAEAAFGIQPHDARRLGLLPPEDEPESKELEAPADKQAPRPADKARRRREKK